ncbi:MAG: hypothetical protein V3R98_02450, partial [Alphaproteobacteria bacterium]
VGAISIKQTYANIYLHLQTPESKGDLVAAKIVDNGDNRYNLVGLYRNEPDLQARQQSQIHYGAFVLEVVGDVNNPTSLKGHYWTDRDTKGEMVVNRKLL